jgi:hypothetical protein
LFRSPHILYQNQKLAAAWRNAPSSAIICSLPRCFKPTHSIRRTRWAAMAAPPWWPASLRIPFLSHYCSEPALFLAHLILSSPSSQPALVFSFQDSLGGNCRTMMVACVWHIFRAVLFLEQHIFRLP